MMMMKLSHYIHAAYLGNVHFAILGPGLGSLQPESDHNNETHQTEIEKS